MCVCVLFAETAGRAARSFAVARRAPRVVPRGGERARERERVFVCRMTDQEEIAAVDVVAAAAVAAGVVDHQEPTQVAVGGAGNAGTEEEEEALRTRHAAELAAVDTDLQEKLSHVGKKNRKKKKALWEEAEQAKSELKAKHLEELVAAGYVSAESAAVVDDAAEETEEDKPKKKSKSQRRREKKLAEEKAKSAALRLEASKFVSGRDVEMKAMGEVLDTKGLKVHDIPADGNCLYRAIEHQLQVAGVSSPPSFADLRRLASQHMLLHHAEYEPFFDAEAEAAGGVQQSFAEYCEDMATSSRWGGQLELRALSEALGRSIEVYSATAPVSAMGAASSSSETAQSPLRVSFHQQYYALGEHYNSVVSK